MKRRFYMYSAWERPMSKLTDEQLGKFLRIYYQMQLTGDTDVDSEDPMVDMMLEVVREQVTFDVRSYERKCEVNKVGLQSQKNPTKPNKTQQNPTRAILILILRLILRLNLRLESIQRDLDLERVRVGRASASARPRSKRSRRTALRGTTRWTLRGSLTTTPPTAGRLGRTR